jgi:hypothetical protein
MAPKILCILYRSRFHLIRVFILVLNLISVIDRVSLFLILLLSEDALINLIRKTFLPTSCTPTSGLKDFENIAAAF